MSEWRSQQARELAEAIGDDGLRRLVAHYGGLRIRIHTRIRPDTELAQRLGMDVYQPLQATYRGEEIDIPRLASARAPGRLERIVARRADGATAAQIAREEGITLRWVRELIHRAREFA